METTKVDPQVWIYNFTLGVAALIKEEIESGYSVKAVVVSASIFKKLTLALGHEPNSICGYVLEVLDENKFIIDDDYENLSKTDVDGYVGLKSHALN